MVAHKSNHSNLLSTKHLCEIPTGSPPTTLNTGRVYKFLNFPPISGYMWETIQDRTIVTIER